MKIGSCKIEQYLNEKCDSGKGSMFQHETCANIQHVFENFSIENLLNRKFHLGNPFVYNMSGRKVVRSLSFRNNTQMCVSTKDALSQWKMDRKKKLNCFYSIAAYSCNNITTTLIQISRLFYFGFFSKTNHQMMI